MGSLESGRGGEISSGQGSPKGGAKNNIQPPKINMSSLNLGAKFNSKVYAQKTMKHLMDDR